MSQVNKFCSIGKSNQGWQVVTISDVCHTVIVTISDSHRTILIFPSKIQLSVVAKLTDRYRSNNRSALYQDLFPILPEATDNERLADAVAVQLEVPLRGEGALGAPPISECRRRVSEAAILVITC